MFRCMCVVFCVLRFAVVVCVVCVGYFVSCVLFRLICFFCCGQLVAVVLLLLLVWVCCCCFSCLAIVCPPPLCVGVFGLFAIRVVFRCVCVFVVVFVCCWVCCVLGVCV